MGVGARKQKKAQKSRKASGGGLGALGGVAGKSIQAIQRMLPGRTSKAEAMAYMRGGKRRKKSAIWYAKEIQRMKLKKKYNKLRYSGV